MVLQEFYASLPTTSCIAVCVQLPAQFSGESCSQRVVARSAFHRWLFSLVFQRSGMTQVSNKWSCSTLMDGIDHVGAEDEEQLLLRQLEA